MSDFLAPPAGFHPTGVQGERGGAPSAFNPNSGDPHPDDPVRLGYHGSHDPDPDVIAQRKAEDPNWTLAEPVTTEADPLAELRDEFTSTEVPA
jgi:hypothetical protein